MNESFNSPLLDEAVHQLSRLPGIGRRTALRLALHILRSDPEMALSLADALKRMRNEMRYCSRCHNVSDQPVCPICSDPRRDSKMICVVENVKDVLTVEATAQYRGLYHVLGGLISPIEGIGPGDLEIGSLVNRVNNEDVREVILALSPTMEGDTTNFYIFRKLQEFPVKVTMLARGLSMGADLDYTDTLTLSRSIQGRVLFSSTFNNA